MTIDRQSWGYRRNTNLSQFLSMDELIDTMVETVRYLPLFRNNSFGMPCLKLILCNLARKEYI